MPQKEAFKKPIVSLFIRAKGLSTVVKLFVVMTQRAEHTIELIFFKICVALWLLKVWRHWCSAAQTQNTEVLIRPGCQFIDCVLFKFWTNLSCVRMIKVKFTFFQ